VVEQPQRSVSEHDVMLVRCLDTFSIHNTSARSSEVSDTALPRPMNVIREGEERVTGASHIIQLCLPLSFLLLAQALRNGIEQTFPLRLLATFELLTGDEQVDSVRLVCAFDTLFEWEGKHTWVIAEPPDVGFGTCETGAVDAGLLTCTNANNGAAVGV
jgi:hypothetical protein